MGAETDRPSRNLDYLLEDDEPKPHRGMFIGLGLVALLLAAGLGYLRFRNGALPSLFSGAKPAHEAPAPDAATGSNPSDASAKDGAASSPDGATPANTVTAPAPTPATPTEVAPAPDNKQLAEVRPKNPAEAVPPAAIAPAAATSPTPEVAPPPDAKPAPVAKPKPAPKPEDPVTMGEKYIYGRGVTQDCGRGLKTIKPAADQSNARAMITMGALYATGHCVGKDLPTAYRFFALALRKDPENAALKQNVERVWGQMTQSERQQAIRITQ